MLAVEAMYLLFFEIQVPVKTSKQLNCGFCVCISEVKLYFQISDGWPGF